MMRLLTLGANSRGNCYVLSNGSESLVVDAGVRMADVIAALQYRVRGIAGVVCSHCHNDHAGFITDYMSAGIPVLGLEDVFAAKHITERAYAKLIEPNRGYAVGRFRVYAFALEHDVPNVGFIIEHPDMGAMLYVTDTMRCEYIFPRMQHILIEANYAYEILERRIDAGETPAAQRQRLRHSHMEIGETIRVVKCQDLSDCNEIMLIHLSDGNSNEREFVARMQSATGIITYTAQQGMTLDFSAEPY